MAGTVAAGQDAAGRALNGFWWRWVGANALAEAIGLGGSIMLGVALAPRLEAPGGLAAALGVAAAAIALGTLLEGALVGVLQARVLRRTLPALHGRRWVLATALGAFSAWVLGMIPSTAMSLAADAGGAAGGGLPEIGGALFLALAAGMGTVLGPVLATPQWAVLRRHMPRAGWWIPANAAAWAVGMVLVFTGMNLMPASRSPLTVALFAVGATAAAGAAVGAVHGEALVAMLRAGG